MSHDPRLLCTLHIPNKLHNLWLGNVPIHACFEEEKKTCQKVAVTFNAIKMPKTAHKPRNSYNSWGFNLVQKCLDSILQNGQDGHVEHTCR